MSNTAATAKGVRYRDYGDPSVLKLEDIPRPSPKAGEVLVRVRAAGVIPMDWKLRAGHLKDFMPLEFPHVPGYELAGTVDAVGEGVAELQPGDEVFGRGSGAYATHAVAPVATLAKKPAQLSFEEAAHLGMSGVTAWQLVDAAGLQQRQRVLIHGGAGGVGSIAVQLAHWKGAHVLATTSTGNVEHVRALGADEVIDYTKGPFENEVTDVDVVLDTVGGDVLDKSWGVLKPGGLLITTAAMMPDAETAASHGVRTAGLPRTENTAPVLNKLAELVVSGVIKPQVAETFPLEDAVRAHAASETGHGRGRRVLIP
ncbi:MAG: NADP-dependent oxidoreductase [Candidatus Dormibacteria bacterium]